MDLHIIMMFVLAIGTGMLGFMAPTLHRKFHQGVAGYLYLAVALFIFLGVIGALFYLRFVPMDVQLQEDFQ